MNTWNTRSAIAIAKSTNQIPLDDRLMKMGSLWKHHPNMACWHNTEEDETSEHVCYRLKVNPDNYHENGHDMLDFDIRARLAVELYYAFREVKSSEERNIYRGLYSKWHPQSYQFRNLRIMIEDNDGDNIPDLVMGHDNIEIREEEYEEDSRDIPTMTDRFDGCSFTIPDHESCTHDTETMSVQVPSHTTKNFWVLVNTHVDQINFDNTFTEDGDDVDESQYTPYYSKSAIKIAESVKDTQTRLGKFSLNKVAEAMLGGAIKNDTDYTRQQILTADTILGRDISYKKGVHTQKQQYKGSEQDDATTNHITLEIDIIFEENLSILTGVALPTSWTVLIQIKDKTAELLLHNIQKMISLFDVMGKKVTHIRVDGEKGVVLASFLNR